MKIVTVQFNYPNRQDFGLLLDVFRKSVKTYMPNIELIEFKIPPPKNTTNRTPMYFYNDVKLKIWVDYLKTATENVIFADCDMLALQSAEHAFNFDFDVAYTQVFPHRMIKPVNCGVMMARPTDAAKIFFNIMYKMNNYMLHNKNYHKQLKSTWGGINQCAFGDIVNKIKGVKLHKYHTIEWNAIEPDWKHINEKTIFVHIKNNLRRLVLANMNPYNDYKKAMELWYNMKNRKCVE